MIHALSLIFAIGGVIIGTFIVGEGGIGSFLLGILIILGIHLSAWRILKNTKSEKLKHEKAKSILIESCIIVFLTAGVFAGIVFGIIGGFFLGVVLGIVAILIYNFVSEEKFSLIGSNILTFLAGGFIGGAMGIVTESIIRYEAVGKQFESSNIDNTPIMIGIVIGLLIGTVFGKIVTAATAGGSVGFIVGGIFQGFMNAEGDPEAIYLGWLGLGFFYFFILIVNISPFLFKKMGLYKLAEKFYLSRFNFTSDDIAITLHNIEQMYTEANKHDEAQRVRLELRKILRTLRKKLNSEERLIQDETINRLIKIGEPASLIFIENLRNSDRRIRWECAQSLGYLELKKGVRPLINTLENDEDEEVRKEAAEALGKIGDPLSVKSLIKALKDRDARVRWKAAEALGKIGDDQAVEALIKSLNDENRVVRRKAAIALGEIRNFGAVEHLVFMINDNNEDETVRMAAQHALNRIKKKE